MTRVLVISDYRAVVRRQARHLTAMRHPELLAELAARVDLLAAP